MPESSRESYERRMKAFLTYMQNQSRPIDDTNFADIQQYILYLKKERNLDDSGLRVSEVAKLKIRDINSKTQGYYIVKQ